MKNKIDIVNAIVVFIMVSFKYLKMYEIFPEYLLYGYLLILIVLVFVNIYTMELSKKEYSKVILILAFCAFTFITNRDVNLIISFCIALLFLKKDNEQFVKYFAWSSIIMFISTILLNLVGILETNDMIRNTDNGTIVRLSLGFDTPNAIFLYFLPIMFAFYYLYGAKKNKIIVFLVSSIVLFSISNCRTGFFITIMFVLYTLICKDNIPKKIQKVLPYLFVIFTIITIGIAIYYGKTMDENLNDILSSRPSLWNYYYEQGLHKSLFGGNLQEDYILDNFYLHIMVHLGIVAYIVYVYIYYRSSKNLATDKRCLNILLFYLIYGLVETNTVLASTNFILVLQFKSIILDKKMERKKIDEFQIN